MGEDDWKLCAQDVNSMYISCDAYMYVTLYMHILKLCILYFCSIVLRKEAENSSVSLARSAKYT